jgi:hypothetical protein
VSLGATAELWAKAARALAERKAMAAMELFRMNSRLV